MGRRVLVFASYARSMLAETCNGLLFSPFGIGFFHWGFMVLFSEKCMLKVTFTSCLIRVLQTGLTLIEFQCVFSNIIQPIKACRGFIFFEARTRAVHSKKSF